MRVLKFTAMWCNPCNELAKSIRESEYFTGTVISVDVDDPTQAKLVARYNVTKVPTCVLLNANSEEIARHVGPMSPPEYQLFLLKEFYHVFSNPHA